MVTQKCTFAVMSNFKKCFEEFSIKLIYNLNLYYDVICGVHFTRLCNTSHCIYKEVIPEMPSE